MTKYKSVFLPKCLKIAVNGERLSSEELWYHGYLVCMALTAKVTKKNIYYYILHIRNIQHESHVKE